MSADRDSLARNLAGPFASRVRSHDGSRMLGVHEGCLTEGEAESVAGLVLASWWLADHDEQVRSAERERIAERLNVMAADATHDAPAIAFGVAAQAARLAE